MHSGAAARTRWRCASPGLQWASFQISPFHCTCFPPSLPPCPQCFYLACLIAFWVRGRANPMLIMFRTPLLAQLDELWRRWDAARRSGTRPW